MEEKEIVDRIKAILRQKVNSPLTRVWLKKHKPYIYEYLYTLPQDNLVIGKECNDPYEIRDYTAPEVREFLPYADLECENWLNDLPLPFYLKNLSRYVKSY